MANSFVTILIKGDNRDFKKELDESERAAKKTNDNLSEIALAARGIAKGAAIAFGFDVLRNLEASEQAAKKLNAVLKSTQRVAGLAADELLRIRGDIFEDVGGFVDPAEIQNAQATLLKFTNISKDAFEDTLRAALNLSAAFDQDLKSSVIQLGKAINDPIRGVSALADVGVTFTESQRDLIRELVESNRLLEAQKVILDELQVEVGGAAEAVAGSRGNSLLKSYQSLRQEVSNLAEDMLSPTLSPEQQARQADQLRRNQQAVRGFLEGLFDQVGDTTTLDDALRQQVGANTARARRTRLSGERFDVAGNLRSGIGTLGDVVSEGIRAIRSVLGPGGQLGRVSGREQLRRLFEGQRGIDLGGGFDQAGLGPSLLGGISLSLGLLDSHLGRRPAGPEFRPGTEGLADTFRRIQNAALQDRAAIFAEKQFLEIQKVRENTDTLAMDIASALRGFLGWQ